MQGEEGLAGGNGGPESDVSAAADAGLVTHTTPKASPILRPNQERGVTDIRAAFAEGVRALVEVERLRAMNYFQALKWAGTSEMRLRQVARARGYKQGWVWHRLQELRSGAA